MMIERLVVYTCILGDYDDLLPVEGIEEGVDYVCFSDQAIPQKAPWQVRLSPVRGGRMEVSRYIKMHPHVLFPDHGVSIYVDANVQVLGGATALARSALSRGNIAMYEHPFRNCVYAEARECSAIGHAWHWRIATQMQAYLRDQFPANQGLYEGNVLIRRHGAKEVQELMHAWWNSYRSGVRRDQLSLTYLAWKGATRILSLGPSTIRTERRHFALKVGHKRSVGTMTRIRGWMNRSLFLKSYRLSE